MNLQHLATEPIGRDDGLQLPDPHGLERDEWVRRFSARIRQRLELPPDLEHIVASELESWPEEPGPVESEWRDYTPEEAADDNLSYWGD